MTANLPVGFVTNSGSIIGDIERIDNVPVEDISKLWKAYTTNKAIFPNDVGVRLENLFWRIWGNDSLVSTITGATLARLFAHISEGQSFIRTTPVQSPRASTTPPPPSSSSEPSGGSPDGERTPRPSRPSSSSSQPASLPQRGIALPPEEASSTTPTEENMRPPRRDSVQFQLASTDAEPAVPSERPKRAMPPSILKKPGQPSRREARTATGDAALGTEPSQEAVYGSVGSENYEVSPKTNQPRPPTPPKGARRESQSGPKKKRASFAAGSAKDRRRRPSFPRRKSSQSSSSGISSSNVPKSPRSRTESALLSPDAEANPFEVPTTARAPVGSSSVFEESMPSGRTLKETSRGSRGAAAEPEDLTTTTTTTAVGLTNLDEPLVDRDFRAKFVNRQQSSSSFLSLPLLSKTTSTVASTSTAAAGQLDMSEPGITPPGRARGKTKAKAQLGFTDQLEPLKPAAAASGVLGDGREDEEDEEEGEGAARDLPRTKSQLTLLLERDRRYSEGAAVVAERERRHRTES
ncbi:MAG: hypothetical protein M1824_003075 [Vezdaea acicularis]|nr:MAG: hypothetical protein M1824_003075 [Vezdaea acicularis]